VDPAVGTAGEVPDAPGVHVSEQQITRVRAIGEAVDVVEHPARLGTREVRRKRQAGLTAEAVLAPVARELVDEAIRARVLPHDRVHHRLARVAIPHDGGLALVRDAQAGDVGRARSGRVERLLHHLLRALPDLVGVVLDPARLRVDLLVLLLRHADHSATVVEDHAA